jgi:anthranilate phosphoribosyltransferase
VCDGETKEFRIWPDSVGLSRATRANIPWKNAEDKTSRSLAALEGEAGPVGVLILYNAALRLWTAAHEGASLAGWVERAREALNSGAALRLLDRLRQPVPVGD